MPEVDYFGLSRTAQPFEQADFSVCITFDIRAITCHHVTAPALSGEASHFLSRNRLCDGFTWPPWAETTSPAACNSSMPLL